jgi:replicative DNA helicase
MANAIVPPQNTEAEKNILGGILIDDSAIVKIADLITDQDFYDPRHRLIFMAIVELFRSNQAIDVVTVTTYLKAHKLISKSGGAAYLTELVSDTASAANIVDYAGLVKETAVRRNLISMSSQINELAREEDRDLSEVINEVETQIFSISNSNAKSDFVHVKDLLVESFEKTDDLHSDPNLVRGIRTGFSKLDTLLGGLNQSDFIILAARPAVGKSSFAIDLARHAAVHENKSVGIFSLEMSDIQIMDRILAMELETSLFALRTGKVGDAIFSKFSNVADRLSRSNLFIDDTPGQTIIDIRTKARKLSIERGLDFLVIDYLQLIQGTRKENRVQEVSDISRSLKILARELNIPIIAAAQLSRAVEQRVDKRPQLSDLRESGSIEQDADIVMFLQREDQFEADGEKKGLANLYIAKHRNGPTGNIELFFVEKQARFRELAT